MSPYDPHSYSRKEREYLGRIEARVEILRARLATTNLPDPQEITKELHALEWVLRQCSSGPSSEEAFEEAAKVCISMYAKSPASRRTDCLLEAASQIRELKRSSATPSKCRGFLPGADPSKCCWCGVRIESHES